MKNKNKNYDFDKKLISSSKFEDSEDFPDILAEFEKMIRFLYEEEEELKIEYNRIPDEYESNVLTQEAISYLLELVNYRTISIDDFEKYMDLCVKMHVSLEKKIDRQMIKQIVGILLFTNINDPGIYEIFNLLNRMNSTILVETIN